MFGLWGRSRPKLSCAEPGSGLLNSILKQPHNWEAWTDGEYKGLRHKATGIVIGESGHLQEPLSVFVTDFPTLRPILLAWADRIVADADGPQVQEPTPERRSENAHEGD